MAPGDITQLLNRMAGETGDERKKSYDELISVAYYDLKRRAAAVLRGNENYTRPTGLVHELYGKLSSYRMDFKDREHNYQQNRYSQALSHYLSASRLRSHDPSVRRKLVLVLTLFGRTEEAQAYASRQ